MVLERTESWAQHAKNGTGSSDLLVDASEDLLLQKELRLLRANLIILLTVISTTYDHRVWKTGLPVRSAVLKPHAGELVVGWVTTSESSLLYVFVFPFLILGTLIESSVINSKLAS
ncbi:hypothetical protein N7461_007477 [Penicillium sp. DV-2018c]|nr:hypothetical protein N7461_007477 [Penicillium sp. DV-2018c]